MTDETTRTFDAAAADFAALAPLLWDPLGRRMVEHTAPRPGERVLDACCGTGASALPAAHAVGPEGQVDAVDLAGALLEHGRRAAEGLPQLRFSRADVTTWQAKDGPYDLVQSAYGVFFLPDMDAGCRHLISLLAAGGRFAVQTWRQGALVDYARCLREAAAEERPLPERPATANASERIDAEDKIGDWLTGLGLRDVRVTELRFTLPLTADLCRALVYGTGWRGLLDGLDDDAVRRVHEGLLTRVDQRGLTELDATSLIALGHHP